MTQKEEFSGSTRCKCLRKSVFSSLLFLGVTQLLWVVWDSVILGYPDAIGIEVERVFITLLSPGVPESLPSPLGVLKDIEFFYLFPEIGSLLCLNPQFRTRPHSCFSPGHYFKFFSPQLKNGCLFLFNIYIYIYIKQSDNKTRKKV